MLVRSTTTQKFGLAWLFANTKRREELARERKLKLLLENKAAESNRLDERISKTSMAMSASQGESLRRHPKAIPTSASQGGSLN